MNNWIHTPTNPGWYAVRNIGDTDQRALNFECFDGDMVDLDGVSIDRYTDCEFTKIDADEIMGRECESAAEDVFSCMLGAEPVNLDFLDLKSID